MWHEIQGYSYAHIFYYSLNRMTTMKNSALRKKFLAIAAASHLFNNECNCHCAAYYFARGVISQFSSIFILSHSR